MTFGHRVDGSHITVIPAKAGTHFDLALRVNVQQQDGSRFRWNDEGGWFTAAGVPVRARAWVPAFAGMTARMGVVAMAHPTQPFPISPSETPAPYNALPLPIIEPA